MNYSDFLTKKLDYGQTQGVEVKDINPMLFDFQKDIVKWALRRGRCAIFADCGLGKTFMQLEWAKNISFYISKPIIIFAPLSVTEQTIEEGQKLNIEVNNFRENKGNIRIANYEHLEDLSPLDYESIIIDESSILKSVDGKTRERLIAFSRNIKYRLACTATPAPNDISEIANHTEFLGIMKREEMLSKWFYNNGKDWTLKGHAIEKFYEWVATWGLFLTKPSDLEYSDDGFVLPKLNIKPVYFDFEYKKNDELFNIGLKGIEDRLKIRKDSVQIKCDKVKDLINNSDEQWIVWCGIDLESDTINKHLKDSVNLKGTDKPEEKINKIKDFKKGKIKVLITKPKIAGFGMNFQCSRNALFFGLSDSYESYYQCIRRQYRFGQKKEVNVYIALAGNESIVYENVLRKESDHKQISQEVIKKVRIFEEKELKGMSHQKVEYEENCFKNKYYTLYHGDSCEVLPKIESNSIDLMVFSPPFASLYTYSNSERDLGNCQTGDEFFKHFDFIIKELHRIIKPGRNIAVHCMNLPTSKIRDGFIGLKDFRGDIIRAFTKHKFIYHSETCIDKNPQAAAIRTHAKGLMFKQMHKDSSHSRMGLADYIVCFKKHGENETAIVPDLNNEEWIKFAHPVWYDIKESDTLNSIKYDKDEKHICPLQLEVIRRCVRLWSNKGETVLSPFAGIGSEGYISIEQGRRFIGIELKKEYYQESIKNLTIAERDFHADLFSVSE